MFQKSDLTQRLYEILRGVNETIEYTAISQRLGLPLDGYRAAMNSARRALERDEGIVFATERGVGLRRLTDQEKVWSTNEVRQSINRRAKAGMRRIESVGDITSLPIADQTTALINRAIFSAVEGQTKHGNKPVAEAPPVQPPFPDLARLLAGVRT